MYSFQKSARSFPCYLFTVQRVLRLLQMTRISWGSAKHRERNKTKHKKVKYEILQRHTRIMKCSHRNVNANHNKNAKEIHFYSDKQKKIFFLMIHTKLTSSMSRGILPLAEASLNFSLPLWVALASASWKRCFSFIYTTTAVKLRLAVCQIYSFAFLSQRLSCGRNFSGIERLEYLECQKRWASM